MLPKLLALSALALVPSIGHAMAPPRGGGVFGIGVGGGLGVSGLSGKYWLGEKYALQGVVGAWGYGHHYYGGHDYDYGTNLGVSLDYLWEMPDITASGPLVLGWNVGLGGTIGIYDPPFIGASGVLGLELDFQPVPIDVVLEYRPGISIVPGIGLDLVNFTGHVRFYVI